MIDISERKYKFWGRTLCLLGKFKKKTKIEELKEKLKEYIKNEEYEKAADVRDEIKKLEAKKDIERGE